MTHLSETCRRVTCERVRANSQHVRCANSHRHRDEPISLGARAVKCNDNHTPTTKNTDRTQYTLTQ